MKYDYKCANGECGKVFEIDKKMADPHPDKCPHCKAKGPERYFVPDTLPSVGYGNDRPPWTYPEAKKFKTATFKGKTTKIDPSKHGDLGSWHSPGQLTKKPKKGKR